MGKGKSIWVDEETYSRLYRLAQGLNMKSIGELLRFLAGTHRFYRGTIDNPEEFLSRAIEILRQFYRLYMEFLRKTIGEPQPTQRYSSANPYESYRGSIENPQPVYRHSIEEPKTTYSKSIDPYIERLCKRYGISIEEVCTLEDVETDEGIWDVSDKLKNFSKPYPVSAVEEALAERLLESGYKAITTDALEYIFKKLCGDKFEISKASLSKFQREGNIFIVKK